MTDRSNGAAHRAPPPDRQQPSTPPARPADDRALVESLYAGRADLRHIATGHNLTLLDLAAWMADPAVAGSLDALCRLADARAALFLSRSRAAAGKSLLRLARDSDAAETARKACVDLLTLRAAPFKSPAPSTRKRSGDGDPGAAEPPEAGDIRSLLEKLGRALAHDDAPAEASNAAPPVRAERAPS